MPDSPRRQQQISRRALFCENEQTYPHELTKSLGQKVWVMRNRRTSALGQSSASSDSANAVAVSSTSTREPPPEAWIETVPVAPMASKTRRCGPRAFVRYECELVRPP